MAAGYARCVDARSRSRQADLGLGPQPNTVTWRRVGALATGYSPLRSSVRFIAAMP